MRLETIIQCVLLLGSAASAPAYAAKAPGEVEKRVVITGDTAISIAKLFGLDTLNPSSIPLRLWKYEVWSASGEDYSTPNNPPQYNLMEFTNARNSPGYLPTLTIYSHWSDLGTQLPEPKLGYYSFQSSFVSDRLVDGCDIWTQVLRRLKAEPGWHAQTAETQFHQMQFQKCYVTDDIEICIGVVGGKSYAQKNARTGYFLDVTVHSKGQ